MPFTPGESWQLVGIMVLCAYFIAEILLRSVLVGPKDEENDNGRD